MPCRPLGTQPLYEPTMFYWGKDFNEISIKTHFSRKKIALKMSTAKCRPFVLPQCGNMTTFRQEQLRICRYIGSRAFRRRMKPFTL